MEYHNVGEYAKKDCCGCSLCSKICPVGVIHMESDEEGFQIPIVDEQKCIHCSLCVRKCPMNSIRDNQIKQEGYMAIAKDPVILEKSASGGLATVLSQFMIENYQGVVYGATMDEEMRVHHIRVLKVADLEKLQGSKYVQSDISKVLPLIKKDLEEERKVLFIGTPCQVQAVLNYTKNAQNLYTCDLVCHGVPSPRAFQEYIDYLEKKYGKKINKYFFRTKSKYDRAGYDAHIMMGNQLKRIGAKFDPYYGNFIAAYNYRLSCYHCPFANDSRVGDLTLGDVASKESYQDFHHSDITSLVIVNRLKGTELLNGIKDMIEYREIDLEKEKKMNHALHQPSRISLHRDTFYPHPNYKTLAKLRRKQMGKKEVLKTIFNERVPYKVRDNLKKVINRDK